MLYVSLLPRLSEPPPEPEPPPSAGNANCYDHQTGDVVDVDSMAELAAAVNNAPSSGRQVLIAPGGYDGRTLAFDRTGRAPVVVRPRDGRGSVTINGANWTLADTSSRIVLANLFFSKNSRIVLNGDHHRISRCQWRGLGGARCVQFYYARDCRVDHCDFSEAQTGSTNQIIGWEPGGFASGKNVRNRVDYCHFHDLRQTDEKVGNGQEMLRFYAQAKNMGLGPAGSVGVVDHCLFANCAYAGEGELISIKSGGWQLSFCTFDTTDFYQQFRTSDNGEIRSCWFERTKGPTFNVFGRNHLFIGNRVMGKLDVRIGAGNSTSERIINGDDDIGHYARAANAQVIGNQMGAGYLIVGGFWSSNPKQQYPCLSANLYKNMRDAGGDAYKLIDGNHSGTTFRDPGSKYTYVPAVKLVPNDVGLGARDPLCPRGPQN